MPTVGSGGRSLRRYPDRPLRICLPCRGRRPNRRPGGVRASRFASGEPETHRWMDDCRGRATEAPAMTRAAVSSERASLWIPTSIEFSRHLGEDERSPTGAGCCPVPREEPCMTLSSLSSLTATEQLARGALRGPADAAAHLLEVAYRESLGPWIRGFIARRGCPPSDLDDLTQEVIRRLLHSRTAYRGSTEREFWAYVGGLCRSVLSHARRSTSRHWISADALRHDGAATNTTATPGDAPPGIRGSEHHHHLRTALSDLTPLQQSVIHLRYRGNCSLRATAMILNRSLSTVAEAERAAMRALAIRLENASASGTEAKASTAAPPRRTVHSEAMQVAARNEGSRAASANHRHPAVAPATLHRDGLIGGDSIPRADSSPHVTSRTGLRLEGGES